MGTLNSSLIHPKAVFKGALLTNPHAIILAHNHPSGETVPSNADKRVTEIRVEAGKLLSIAVCRSCYYREYMKPFQLKGMRFTDNSVPSRKVRHPALKKMSSVPAWPT